MINLKSYLCSKEVVRTNRVVYLSNRDAFEPLEQFYLDVRSREGRLYSDDVLPKLPEIEKTHPLYHEWQMRGKSCRRFKTYLMKQRKPLTILDLGCGNGWMAHQLAAVPDCDICAMDVNRFELEQAARVFSGQARLTFLYGDIFKEVLPPESLDLIVMASAIQYFPDLQLLLNRLLALMPAHGEIHILDSPFYPQALAAQAARRTEDYYRQVGVPDMASYYHHHTYEELKEFQPVFLYGPDTLFRRLARKFFASADSPFPWIKIAKSTLTDGNQHEKKSTLSQSSR